jgi:hypothetical protein
MHSIEKTTYGYKLCFGGFIKADEMLAWVKDAERHLASQIGPFGVIVDMRELKPLPSDSQTHLQAGQKLFKATGMQRSAVVLHNPVITLQFKRMAQETGIYQWERYFDSSVTGWESKANAWVTAAVDPDK